MSLRPDLLLLEDDPAFLPDILFGPLDADFDLLNLNTGLVTDTQSTNTSSFRAASTPLDQQVTLMSGNLVLPTSETGYMGDFFLPGGCSSHGPRPSSFVGRDIDTILEGDLFDFDTDGNIQELRTETNVSHKHRHDLLPSDAAVHARVRQEHTAGQQAGQVYTVSIGFRTKLCEPSI
jgi:hypothetical protein